jgi:hypothetical protein
MPVYHDPEIEAWDKEFKALWGDTVLLESFCSIERLYSMAFNAVDSPKTNGKLRKQCEALLAEIDRLNRIKQGGVTVDDMTESELSALKIGMMLAGAMSIAGWTKSPGAGKSRHWQDAGEIFIRQHRDGVKMTEAKLWASCNQAAILPPGLSRESFNRTYKRKVKSWRELSRT